MTTLELVEELRVNASMKNRIQEDNFFEALESLELLPDKEFDDDMFCQLCTVLTDDTGRMDGIGSIMTLLDVRYLQATSPDHYYELVDRNVDAFFPNAMGWLATLLAEGLFSPATASVLNEKVKSFTPIQATILRSKLQGIFQSEELPLEGQVFITKLVGYK